MLYLTADLHLGHANILTLGEGRPFASIEEHDRVIVDNINATVSEEDELWILGDVGMRPKAAEYAAFGAAVRCRHVHLVLGNHDREGAARESGAFESVQHYARVGRLARDGYRAVLFHYPILEWDGMYRGSYMLHGHIHSRPDCAQGCCPELLGTYVPPRGMGYNAIMRERWVRRYDVGVDANGYRPVAIDEVMGFFGGVDGCSGRGSGQPSRGGCDTGAGLGTLA